MRTLLYLAVISFSLLSCKKERSESFGKIENQAETHDPVTLGTKIFEGKGACIACHKTNEKLVGLENVIITPHVGSRTHENVENQGTMSIKNTVDFLKN